MTMMRVYTLLLALTLLPLWGHAQPSATISESTVTLTPSIASPEVGERVTLRIEILDRPEIAEAEVKLPADQSALLRMGRVRPVGGNVFEVEIRPLKSGPLDFGPLDFKLKESEQDAPEEISSGSFRLDVAAPGGEQASDSELRDFKAPREASFNYLWRNLIYAGIGLVALGVLALCVWALTLIKRRRAEEAAKVPVIPPIISAMEAVRRLKSMEAFDQEGPERHYTALSMSIRRYIEDELHLNAVEMSDDEMLDLLRGEMRDYTGSSRLIEVFQRSSMAKFARALLGRDQAADDVVAAEEFLLAEEARLKALAAREKDTSGEERAA